MYDNGKTFRARLFSTKTSTVGDEDEASHSSEKYVFKTRSLVYVLQYARLDF